MSVDLPSATTQRHVKEVLLLSDVLEGRPDVAFEVVPFETKLFAPHSLCEWSLSKHAQLICTSKTGSVLSVDTFDVTSTIEVKWANRS